VDDLRLWFERDGLTLQAQRRPGVMIRVGTKGLGVAPSNVQLQPIPGVPGAQVVGLEHPARDVQLSVSVRGTDREHFYELLGQLRQITDPTQGGFWLNAARGTEIRRLKLHLRGGLEDTPERGAVAQYVLDCVASQPFAESYSPHQIEYYPMGANPHTTIWTFQMVKDYLTDHQPNRTLPTLAEVAPIITAKTFEEVKTNPELLTLT